MSCSHLIDTYVNSKYLYRGVNRFRRVFTCGKCDACIRRQRTEWRVRAYYEARDCLARSRSNFVLFDTLTYCDDAIKRYSDIFPEMSIPSMLNEYCFSREDVQKFFKRLRINLKRAGYRFPPQGLRYLLTSEYGTSEETNGFRNTHRPHYHILFFVSFPISAVEFSRYVSRSWSLGKTDGVRPYDDCSLCPLLRYCRGKCLYNTPQYVVNERLVTGNSPANCMKCVNYVTKYISKDMYITGLLQDRVDLLFNYLFPDYRKDIFLYGQYRRFSSQVLPFHLQSQSFGLSLLRDPVEREYLVRTNKVHLPTFDKEVVRSVALPRYYQRKLYYDYKIVDGRVKWYLTDYGIGVRLQQLDRKIASFMSDYRAYDPAISSSRLYDLALYKMVYRGTLADYQSLLLPYKEYYRRLISPHLESEQPLYYNFNRKVDKLTIGSFLSTRYVITPDGEIVYKGKQLHRDFLPYDGYVVVTDKVCPYWSGFDRKLVSFEAYQRGVANGRDQLAYHRDVANDYYRQLGLLPS